MEPTRALSLRPQWIQAILLHGKRTENREWPEGYAGLSAALELVGETFYLHAGLGKRADYEASGFALPPWSEVPRGALVATARLVAVVGPDDPRVDKWGDGSSVALILADVRPLAKPFPMAGKLGFFHVEVPPKARATLAAVSVPSAPASPDLAARRSEAARKANATRKANKLAAAAVPVPEKPATDWSEAGRRAYKTKLRNAAARGDSDAAAKLAALPD